MIIKVGNNEYWNTKHDPNRGADGLGLDGCDARWNICISARNIGKSYCGKTLAIDNFIEQGKEFALVRSFADDLKSTFVENYWSDMYEYFYSKAHKRWPDFKSFGIVPYRGAWNVKGFYESGDSEPLGTIGRWFALNTSGRYKSQTYPDINMLIMEEFIPEPGTTILPNMTEKLLSICSTIFRSRTDWKAYLWANAIDPNNTIFEEWGIDPNQLKQGEIKVFDYRNEKGIVDNRVAVDWVRELEQDEESFGWQNFNRVQSVMLHKGSWQTKSYRLVEEDTFDRKKPQLSIVLDYNFIHLYLYAFENKDGTYNLVACSKRMTNAVEYIILNQSQTNVKRKILNLNSNFKGAKKLKEFIYTLYLNDLVYFDDNLTGVNFERVLDTFF